MNNQFQTISNSELDDFNTSCQRNKVAPKDFSLDEHSITETPAGNGLHHPHGKVTISRNEKSRTYITGHGSKWPSEFDADLNSGAFS